MDIRLDGHDEYNACLQIMQLFFAKDDLVTVTSRLRLENGDFFSEASVEKDGKIGEAFAKTGEKDRLHITNTIKKAVYLAAKKVSDMPTPWGISTGIRPAKTAVKLLEKYADREKAKSELIKEYMMSEEKAELAVTVAEFEKEALSSMPKNSVSVYVGIPFCPSRCSYCSFISQAVEHNKRFVEPYVRALLREIEYGAEIVKDLGQSVDTVYFGGGTPTALSPELLRELIEKVRASFDLSKLREFTVEAGRPDTFTKEMTNMLSDCGIGRISINPQTMHQVTLDAVGRRHSVEDVKKAFYLAREAGIKSINADLIAGLPGEDEEMMAYSVREIANLKPNAVTVHTLYMKRAADMIGDFHRLRFSKNTAAMMNAASKILKNEGMHPYYMYKQRNTLGNLENVGFAEKGHESLYNIYIMEEVQPILALGAGGSTKMVGKEKIERVFNPKDAADYTARIEEVLGRKDIYRKYYGSAE